jgi:hypothetical protein
VKKLLENVNEDEVVKVEDFHVPNDKGDSDFFDKSIKADETEEEKHNRNRSSTNVLKDREKGSIVNANSLIDTPDEQLDFDQG